MQMDNFMLLHIGQGQEPLLPLHLDTYSMRIINFVYSTLHKNYVFTTFIWFDFNIYLKITGSKNKIAI